MMLMGMVMMSTWERWPAGGCWRRTCQLQCFWHSWTSGCPRCGYQYDDHYVNDDDYHDHCDVDEIDEKAAWWKINHSNSKYSEIFWDILQIYESGAHLIIPTSIGIICIGIICILTRLFGKTKALGTLGGIILLYICLSGSSLWKKEKSFWKKSTFSPFLQKCFPYVMTMVMSDECIWYDITFYLLTVSRARWYSLSARSNSLREKKLTLCHMAILL